MANPVPSESAEKLALKAVIKWEESKGRKAVRVHKCGYDLVSTGGSGERHIEVRATAKTHFTWRWLEEIEHQAFLDDPRFYLYLVTDAKSGAPKVWRYSGKELKQRFSRVEKKYIFVFPPGDFSES